MSELPAGRELDALVAEKVMGWQWSVHPAKQHPDLRYLRADGPPSPYGVIIEHGHVEYTHHLPAYSTDIAAAWQVVERMRERGMLFRLQYGKTKPLQRQGHGATNIEFGPEWAALFQHPLTFNEASATADTAPLAICLAALKAVGHE